MDGERPDPMQEFYRRHPSKSALHWPPKRSTVSGLFFGLSVAVAMTVVGGILEGNWAMGAFVGAVSGVFGGPFFAHEMAKYGIDDGEATLPNVLAEWRVKGLFLPALFVTLGIVLRWLTEGPLEKTGLVVSLLGGIWFLILWLRSRV